VSVRKTLISLLIAASPLLLAACGNPLSDESRVENGFAPGLPVTPAEPLNPVSASWSLDTANQADFTSSAPTLEFGATSVGHKLLTQDRDDDNSYGFGAALNVGNVAWSAGDSAMELTAAGMTARTGSFESRVFDARSATSWTKLAWNSGSPAGKAYPNAKAAETAYDTGNIDMANNVLLLHMDEASWTGPADEVIDSSGSGHHATIVGAPTTAADGKFSRRGEFTANGQYLTVAHSSDFDTTTALTLEAWVYPTTVDANVRGIISKRVSSGSAVDYAFTMFTQNPGAQISIDLNATTNRWATGVGLTLNAWQHLVYVYDASQTAASSMRQRLYVNGVLRANANTSQIFIQATTAAAPVHIGSLVGNNVTTFLGRMDEVAIYDRALSAAEVTARYQRGAQRIKLQARACAAADCLGETYVGPDGTAATYFTEGANSGLTAETSHTLSSFAGKEYFQYKAVLETDAATLAPRLKSVRITPDLYDPGYPTVTNNTGLVYRGLTSFSAVTGGTGAVRFQISNGTSWYYWNGSAWAIATLGYSHASTKQEVADHIATFASAAGSGTISFKAFFDAGAVAADPATLSSVTITGGI
jgi:hypothetical protein